MAQPKVLPRKPTARSSTGGAAQGPGLALRRGRRDGSRDPSLRLVFAEAVHLGEVSGSTEAEFRAALVGLRRAKNRQVERLRIGLTAFRSFGT